MKEYFKNKTGFWPILLYEIISMWSNEKSFFASKRFERFFMFLICMWLIVGYIVRKWTDLSVEEVLMLAGFLMGFSAWNATQLRKDTELKNTNEDNKTVIAAVTGT